MTKLKKTKSFSVSNETLSVRFKGNIHEIANLLKSGIINQSIILVAINDVWEEVNILDIGGDNSDLNLFKIFIENHNLGLSDIGLAEETIKKDYSLKYTDFEDLATEFPVFNYVEIGKLYDFVNNKTGQASMFQMRKDLAYLSRIGKSINDFIAEPSIDIDSRIKKLESLGMCVNSEGLTGYGITLTRGCIQSDSDEDFNVWVNKITAAIGLVPLDIQDNGHTSIPVAPAEVTQSVEALPASIKKPVSLETIGALSADRISELAGLEEKQNKIVADNPFIIVTDKKSLENAKKHRANLLSASTAIDGKDGLEANANKFLNQFKSTLKNFFAPLSEKTRIAHKKQADEITRYENAEALKIQEENRLKLEKIKKRTDLLFAVPFVFNGELYSLGTIFVLPSQIENSTDEEFNLIIENGKKAKLAIDSAESKKDARIKKLEEQLAAIQGLNNLDNTTMAELPTMNSSIMPERVEIIQPTVSVSVPKPSVTSLKFIPGTTYEIPTSNNKILNDFDLMHVDVLKTEPILPAYIKCREYFKFGSKKLAEEIVKILNDTDVTVKKSVKIAELCEIIKNS